MSNCRQRALHCWTLKCTSFDQTNPHVNGCATLSSLTAAFPTTFEGQNHSILANPGCKSIIEILRHRLLIFLQLRDVQHMSSKCTSVCPSSRKSYYMENCRDVQIFLFLALIYAYLFCCCAGGYIPHSKFRRPRFEPRAALENCYRISSCKQFLTVWNAYFWLLHFSARKKKEKSFWQHCWGFFM